MSVIYYNTIKCEDSYKSGEHCRNNAYYCYLGKNVCGVHSKKEERVKLPRDPNSKQKKETVLKDRIARVEKKAARNKRKGKRGKVICTKLRMMKQPDHVDGFLKVFPNFKHQNRNDGFGCKSLSPKDMGPIDHGQPGMPIALNLENFHQGNKVFPVEVDEKKEPVERFFETQRKMYQDPIPHRHKKEAVGKNKNIPVYSLWKREDGTLVKCTYFESRQFYCTYYERIAPTLDDFEYLQDLLNDGYNLQICGYDAYDITGTLEEHYCDITRPFGHELVLYTLLTAEPDDYPWRKYKTEEF